ncbi:MAG: Zn-ribbon domain-containing OB-fold protein [Chloroflexi bacterium]|nr:Zn-ribbon domain-containing OB-fold protein [Chloroflexota bacterium]
MTTKRKKSAKYKKPLPLLENPELTQPFWEAAKRHELVLPRCRKCGNFHFYPRHACPVCLSPELEYAPVSGKGRLYSFTVVRQPANPVFNDDVPYIYAVVQLNEGPMMVSNLVECRIEAAKVDMPVTAVFDDVTPEWTLVKFKPD